MLWNKVDQRWQDRIPKTREGDVSWKTERWPVPGESQPIRPHNPLAIKVNHMRRRFRHPHLRLPGNLISTIARRSTKAVTNTSPAVEF